MVNFNEDRENYAKLIGSLQDAEIVEDIKSPMTLPYIIFYHILNLTRIIGSPINLLAGDKFNIDPKKFAEFQKIANIDRLYQGVIILHALTKSLHDEKYLKFVKRIKFIDNLFYEGYSKELQEAVWKDKVGLVDAKGEEIEFMQRILSYCKITDVSKDKVDEYYFKLITSSVILGEIISMLSRNMDLYNSDIVMYVSRHKKEEKDKEEPKEEE